jgi:hypothetical protein
MKEIDLPTGKAKINTNSSGASITIDGFKASFAQLRVLSKRGREITANVGCAELGIARNTYNKTLRDLIDANTDDLRGITPTLDQLTETARKHELLYPLSIIGLEVVAAEMRKK